MYFYSEIETWPSTGFYLKKEKSTIMVKSSDKKKAESKLQKHLIKKFEKKKTSFSFKVHDTI